MEDHTNSKLRYKLSYGHIHTYCNDGLLLDREIAWAIARGMEPKALRVEVEIVQVASVVE